MVQSGLNPPKNLFYCRVIVQSASSKRKQEVENRAFRASRGELLENSLSETRKKRRRETINRWEEPFQGKFRFYASHITVPNPDLAARTRRGVVLVFEFVGCRGVTVV